MENNQQNLDETLSVAELKRQLKQFRDERDWAQFHDPKNLASAISIEAAELQEHFLWMNKEQILQKMESDPSFRNEVEEELADVFNYCLTFANATGVDIMGVAKKKLEQNAIKYPVDKAKGNATKYTKL